MADKYGLEPTASNCRRAQSWLYERREQLDGLRPFVEIARRLIYPVPPHDRGDVEQEIVITLKRVTDRRGEVGKAYLWGAARNVVKLYWRRRYRQARRFRHLSDWEKRRVAQLHNEGLSVSKIARAMGRSRKTIDLCLVRVRLREAPPYLARGITV